MIGMMILAVMRQKVPCSEYPDLDKIRNIEITIGDEFIIRDQITLPPEDSSNIREI